MNIQGWSKLSKIENIFISKNDYRSYGDFKNYILTLGKNEFFRVE